MALFIVQSGGPVTVNVGQAQIDLIAISKIDSGIGFEESATVDREGVTCIPVTYAQTESGPTPDRLNDLVNEVTYTAPPDIIIFATQNPEVFFLSDGSPLLGNGFALSAGHPDSPFANHVCTLYDITLCGGDGMWVDQEGGGKVMMTTEVMLYHELSHCLHFSNGTFAVDSDGNFDSAQEEVNAEIDENDMRDVRGIPHRDVNSHNGGCGGGVDSCCIVATLATGSPYSADINSFRHLREHVLRRSRAGDDFFKNFFERYYAFSPEVTRLMGRRENIGPLIKDRFVTPLLAGCELLIYYTDSRGQGLVNFLREQREKEGMETFFQPAFLQELGLHLRLVANYQGEEMLRDVIKKQSAYRGILEVLKYVNKKTLKDEYISWTLIDVVDIWKESVMLLHSGKSDSEAEKRIYELISDWMGGMPVTDIWDGFTRLETELELDALEGFIFDPSSKDNFARRLIAKHPRHKETIVRWAKKERRDA